MGKSGPVYTTPAKPRLARMRLRFTDSLRATLSVLRTFALGPLSREPTRWETQWTYCKEVFECFGFNSDTL